MDILISAVVIVVVLGFGLWAFSGVLKLRGRGSGQQTAESWYSRFADRKPPKG